MKLKELDRWFSEKLLKDFTAKDYAMNSLQVGDSESDIKKVAFAVDACMETFKKAADAKADLLFTHHGLFWGTPLAITGDHYRRIKFLLDNNLALYSSHLPLDMNKDLGNNRELCRFLQLENIEPFGSYKGYKISYKGELPEPLPLESIIDILFPGEKESIKILPFGKKKIKTVGLITGGGAHETLQAIEEELDLYITGESLHQIYHSALEAKINVIFGGHYYTELWGAKALQRLLEKELKLETVFIDVPTGL